MSDSIVVAAPPEDLFYRARTTQVQFAALARRFSAGTLGAETAALTYYHALRPALNVDEQVIHKWLKNGWNTESLLRRNLKTLDGEGLRASLQWAFPQAYYSAYTITCAYFSAVGFTESSHAAVINKLGKQILNGSYPATAAFVADGAQPRSYAGLEECNIASPLDLDVANPANVDTHIRRFLNATREDDLRQRRNDMRGAFRTSRGQVRKNLRAEDWARVSERLGPTSVLSLLYRKRIKANYRDIDTFLCDQMDAERLYRDLIVVVSRLNFTHEAFIAKAIGYAWLAERAERLAPQGHRFLAARLAAIASLGE